MKKAIATIALMCAVLRGAAEEGFWLPMLLGESVYADMVKKGLKLSKEQLFSLNKNSLKDAIVRFNNRSSGVFISSEGLVLTDYQSKQNLLAALPNSGEAFYAKSAADEIPVSSLYVDVLVHVDDVSSQFFDSMEKLSGAEREKFSSSFFSDLEKKNSDEANGTIASASKAFNGRQYLLFTYRRYRDVRLVATPGNALGSWGNESGAWTWPRFNANFSLFRIYAGSNGGPAAASTSNKPFKPAYSMPVSLKGFKEGDLTLTYGAPAFSNRFDVSAGIKQLADLIDAADVKLYTIQQQYLLEEMKKDPAIRTQLNSSYQDLSQRLKYRQGQINAIKQRRVYELKRTQEEKFAQWAQGNIDNAYLFRDWNKLYDFWTPYAKYYIYMNVGLLGSPLMVFADSLQALENALVKQQGGDLKKIIQALSVQRQRFMTAENKSSDKKILAAMLRQFYTDIDKSQHPIGFYEGIKGSFGDLRDETTYAKYVAAVIDHTIIFDDARWNAFISNPDASVLQEDPAFKTASSFLKNWRNKYQVYLNQYLTEDESLRNRYIVGMMQMEPKKPLYPEADGSLRLSYGNVKSYNPSPSVHYDYVATMKGLLDKYTPTNGDIELPADFIDSARKKSFAPYLDKTKNDLIIAFICSNDMVPGSEGSAVVNANGELMGLVAETNEEGLATDVYYDLNVNRSICVDIRFILWYIDKISGGSRLIRECKLVR